MDTINDDRGKGCSHRGQPAPTSVNICNIKMSNITFNNGGSFTIAFNQGKEPVVATETAADGDDGDGAANANNNSDVGSEVPGCRRKNPTTTVMADHLVPSPKIPR